MTPMRQKTKIYLIIFIGLIWIFFGVTALTAQEADSEWSEPVNVSQSGAATNPLFLMESDGSQHVIWQDTFIDNYRYIRTQGNSWSRPGMIWLRRA